MWFDNRNDPTLLKAGVKDWQTRYPQNPGAKMLPTALVNMQNYKPASTNKIALLLPLNSQAAVFSRTIQQGFEAAKKMARRPSPEAPFLPVAQAANVASSDVVSPSQAEVGDLTSANTAPVPVQAPAADRAPASGDGRRPPLRPALRRSSPPPATPPRRPHNLRSARHRLPVATTPANPSAELKFTTPPRNQ